MGRNRRPGQALQLVKETRKARERGAGVWQRLLLRSCLGLGQERPRCLKKASEAGRGGQRLCLGTQGGDQKRPSWSRLNGGGETSCK